MDRTFSVISGATGFALMKRASVIDSEYESSPVIQRSQTGLRRVRSAFSNIKPANYRGVERCPLSDDARAPIGWAGSIEDVASLEAKDKAARTRLRELLGPEYACDFSPCYLVPRLEQATDLLSLVDSPNIYELVRLTRAPDAWPIEQSRFLGFDVGYWGGGNFSILCDTAIWPYWHPPYDESLPQLSLLLAELNEHILFADYKAADRFRQYYRTQEWAEIEDEPGEFSIIGVEHIDTG